jgi:L-histidine N-alpha-methyltransferase
MMASASCGLNAGLDADFRTEAFEHVAFFDEANSWIEMRLRANGAQIVRIDGVDLELTSPTTRNPHRDQREVHARRRGARAARGRAGPR